MPAREAGGRVCVIGSVNEDFILRTDRRPEPGETVTGATLERHPGGKGANQAVAAARCGASVELLACVGSDPVGVGRLDQLREEGVGTSHVVTTPRAATGIAVITVTPDGENTIVVAPGANALLAPGDLARASDAIRRADVVVAQLEISTEVVVRAAELADSGALFLLNVAPYRPLPAHLLARVDVLVANLGEAAAMTGTGDGAAGGSTGAIGIRGRGPRAAVVTAGADGAYVSDDDGETHIPAPQPNVVDTTGAGDAFVGALAAELARGGDLRTAARKAVVVGAATTESVGALPRVPADLW